MFLGFFVATIWFIPVRFNKISGLPCCNSIPSQGECSTWNSSGIHMTSYHPVPRGTLAVRPGRIGPAKPTKSRVRTYQLLYYRTMLPPGPTFSNRSKPIVAGKCHLWYKALSLDLFRTKKLIIDAEDYGIIRTEDRIDRTVGPDSNHPGLALTSRRNKPNSKRPKNSSLLRVFGTTQRLRRKSFPG